jgi:hypothetical protein
MTNNGRSAEKAWRAAMAPSIGRPKTLKVAATQTLRHSKHRNPATGVVVASLSLPYLFYRGLPGAEVFFFSRILTSAKDPLSVAVESLLRRN